MFDPRLLGPIFLAAGSCSLLFPRSLDAVMLADDVALAGFALLCLGLSLALFGWRHELDSASRHGHAALQQFTGRRQGGGPAKRLRIRIRCRR